jgi:putative membrane protein
MRAVLTAISKQNSSDSGNINICKNTVEVETEAIVEKPEWVYKITISQLLLASTSGSKLVISAVIAFAFQFDELIPYEKYLVS